MATKKAASGAVEVRVLVRTYINGEWVDPDTVVGLTQEQLAEFAGCVDADPDAVAYAKSLLSE